MSVKKDKKAEAKAEILEQKKTKYHLFNDVKWIEKYAKNLDNIFRRLPEFLQNFIATLTILVFAATLRGEWVVILVTALKQYNQPNTNESVDLQELLTAKNLKMENFTYFFFGSHAVSFSIYFLMGGFLHWYFYINKRHLAKEWKIQPNKWLSPEEERHEIMLGSLSLLITGTFSALLGCYIFNGNPCTIYYKFDAHGWWWFFFQFPVIFLYIDYTEYSIHRLYHTPWLYKHFHKWHHKYKQPTAFSVTALHPVEIVHMQFTMYVPAFTIPVHWFPFYGVILYGYFFNILSHSGIIFKAQWWQPWQQDSEFHDQHHEFFHCNFGFNTVWWDQLHGTMRKKNHAYTEETFHGEAPSLETPEGKAMLAENPDLIASKVLLDENPEMIEDIKIRTH